VRTKNAGIFERFFLMSFGQRVTTRILGTFIRGISDFKKG
jgi:hypothetical protein